MNMPRIWKVLAAITLLTQPAWGAGFMDPAVFEREIATGNALMDQWIVCTRVATEPGDRSPRKTNPEGWHAAYDPALNFPKSYNIPEPATDFPDRGDFARK